MHYSKKKIHGLEKILPANTDFCQQLFHVHPQQLKKFINLAEWWITNLVNLQNQCFQKGKMSIKRLSLWSQNRGSTKYRASVHCKLLQKSLAYMWVLQLLQIRSHNSTKHHLSWVWDVSTVALKEKKKDRKRENPRVVLAGIILYSRKQTTLDNHTAAVGLRMCIYTTASLCQ